MIVSPPPNQQPVQDANGKIQAAWSAHFTDIFNSIGAIQTSGTTAERPTRFLYIGRQYFDTTLNLPIWLKSVKPSVWIKADGTVV